MKRWRLLTVTSDEDYMFDGVKVFEATVTDEYCTVKDPQYKKRYRAIVSYLKGKTNIYKIAILEVSFCVYCIYVYCNSKIISKNRFMPYGGYVEIGNNRNRKRRDYGR